LAPKSVEARQGELLSLMATGNFAEAEAAATKLLEMDPENYSLRLRLCYILRQNRKFEEAVKTLRHVQDTFPADLGMWQEVAALKETRDPAAASLKADEVFDATLDAAWKSSLASEAAYKYADAHKSINDVYKTNQKSYQVTVRLAWLSYLIGDYAAADKYYNLAIHLAPSAIEPKVGRLYPQIAQSQFTQAATLGAQITKLDKQNYAGLYWQAYALHKQNKSKIAESLLEQLNEAYPSDTSVLNLLGEVRAALHQRGPARAAFQQVLALDPNNATATQQLKSL
jgi:tetratricopeptide (TPR) repeat protein